MLGELGREIECLGSKGEESVEGFLAVEKDASVEGAEVMFSLRGGSKEQVDMCIPPVKSGNLRLYKYEHMSNEIHSKYNPRV